MPPELNDKSSPFEAVEAVGAVETGGALGGAVEGDAGSDDAKMSSAVSTDPGSGNATGALATGSAGTVGAAMVTTTEAGVVVRAGTLVATAGDVGVDDFPCTTV